MVSSDVLFYVFNFLLCRQRAAFKTDEARTMWRHHRRPAACYPSEGCTFSRRRKDVKNIARYCSASTCTVAGARAVQAKPAAANLRKLQLDCLAAGGCSRVVIARRLHVVVEEASNAGTQRRGFIVAVRWQRGDGVAHSDPRPVEEDDGDSIGRRGERLCPELLLRRARPNPPACVRGCFAVLLVHLQHVFVQQQINQPLLHPPWSGVVPTCTRSGRQRGCTQPSVIVVNVSKQAIYIYIYIFTKTLLELHFTACIAHGAYALPCHCIFISPHHSARVCGARAYCAHTQITTHTRRRTRTHTHARAHTHARTHTHVRAHTRTHSLSPPLSHTWHVRTYPLNTMTHHYDSSL